MVRAAQDAMAPLRVRAPLLVPQVRTAVTDSRHVTPIPVRPVGPLVTPARPCAGGCGELVISGAKAGRPRRYVRHAHRVTAARGPKRGRARRDHRSHRRGPRTSPAMQYVHALVLITAQTSQQESTIGAGVYFAHNRTQHANPARLACKLNRY